jgi:hypothetical protein
MLPVLHLGATPRASALGTQPDAPRNPLANQCVAGRCPRVVRENPLFCDDPALLITSERGSNGEGPFAPSGLREICAKLFRDDFLAG